MKQDEREALCPCQAKVRRNGIRLLATVAASVPGVLSPLAIPDELGYAVMIASFMAAMGALFLLLVTNIEGAHGCEHTRQLSSL